MMIFLGMCLILLAFVVFDLHSQVRRLWHRVRRLEQADEPGAAALHVAVGTPEPKAEGASARRARRPRRPRV